MTEFLETNEHTEARMALLMTNELLIKVKRNDYYWKWTIIVFHNCLQAFMVLALKGTNGLNIIRPRDRKKWLEAHYNDEPYPETKLKSFQGLFDSLCSEEMRLYTHSKLFIPESVHIGAIDIINIARNRFIHFQPIDLSLQIDGYPGIFLSLIEILEFIILESGNYFDYNDADLEDTKTELEKLRELLEELDWMYTLRNQNK